MLLSEDLAKFDVETNQKCSRENSQDSIFLLSDVFIAFGSFLLIRIIS